MELAGLLGPFALTLEAVASVEHLVGCAVYVLGFNSAVDEFLPQRVGQTDTDVSVHLHQYRRHYKTFYYAQCSSSDEAYATVCRLYHELLPKDNVTHPVRPNSHQVACPVCGREDLPSGGRRVVRRSEVESVTSEQSA